MAFQWRLCVRLFAVGTLALGLAACGSSSVESALYPSRIIAFGDGQSDIGQSGLRYTVSGIEETSNWTEQVARDYGLDLQPANQGGLSYAWGNSRVVEKPDAAANAHSPTLSEQIDAFLSTQQFGSEDLVLISAGASDVIALGHAAFTDAISREQAAEQAWQAGEQFTEQVQRLRSAGANYIAVIGTYDLAASLWARDTESEFLRHLSRQFNEAVKVSMQEVGYGNQALYIDFENYINEVVWIPGAFGIDNIDAPICTSVDPGEGIGIGAGEVNSALCNTGTLVPGEINRFAFADRIYLTPTLHRQFGNWAYNEIRDRW